MTNLKLSLIVDVLMFLALAVTLFATTQRGWREVHELAGQVFTVLVIVHLALHRFYLKNFLKIISKR